MTWKTHKLVTATVVLALTGNPVWAFISAVGSIFPDKLEFILYGQNVPRWKHRKYTHWPVPYVVIAAVAFFVVFHLPLFSVLNAVKLSRFKEISLFLRDFNFPLWQVWQVVPIMIFWFSVGCLFHILEDALSGRVPLFSPSRKTFGIRLIQTRSSLETFVFICSVVAFAFVIRWKLGV